MPQAKTGKALDINFLGPRKLFFAISAILIVASIASVLTRGLNFGIDFTGGVLLEVGYPRAAELESIRGLLQESGYEGALVQNFGTATDVLVRLPPQAEGMDGSAIRDTVLGLLRQQEPGVDLRRVEFVGPQVGEELTERRPLDFLTRSEIAAQPSGSSEPAYILARSADEDQVIAFTIYERQRNRRMMVNVVDIEKLATLELMPVETAPEPEPEPVVEAAPEPEPVALPAQDAAELESGLVADGRVVVNAILFEFDRAEILPESAEALATVAALMQDRAGLSLLVVGHTDGVGSFDYNLRLSVERATAVVDWLRTRHGISADRLRPAGAGPMSPITTNRTEAGRALNRRVELVEMID